MACGASPASVGGLVLREAVLMAGAGAVIGAAAALATGRFVESLLFGVQPNDPLVLTTAALIVISTAFVACVSPAVRAARTDPLTVLRADG
jgi:ABC-type antimicrobial peptide transport system permease subunit